MTSSSGGKTDNTPTPSAQPPPGVRRRKVRRALLHLQRQWHIYQNQLARPGIQRATEERALAHLTTIANQLTQLLPEARELLVEAEIAMWEHTAQQMAQDATKARTRRRQVMTTELRRQRTLVEHLAPWLQSLEGVIVDERGEIHVPDVAHARAWWLRYYPDYVSPTGELLVELVYHSGPHREEPSVWASRWCRVPNWTVVPDDEEREPPITIRPAILAKRLHSATPSQQKLMGSGRFSPSAQHASSNFITHDEHKTHQRGTDG